MRNSALFALALALCGCAAMSESECRSVDWYDIGWRDARFKVQNQSGLYAEQCGRHGVKFAVDGYAKGYQEGRWEFPDRTP